MSIAAVRSIKPSRTGMRAGKVLINGLGIAVAAVWALFQYYGHVEENHVQEVLKYRQELRTQPLFEAWTSAMAGTKDTARLNAALSSNAKWRAYSLQNAERRHDGLIALFRFYDDLYHCVTAGLCDEPTANSIFGYEAHFLYDNYFVFIACRRTTERHFGEGLKHFMAGYVQETEHRQPREFTMKAADCPPEPEDIGHTAEGRGAP